MVRFFLTALLLGSPLGLAAETLSTRLPLAVDSPANSLTFELAAPTGAVLSGLLLPANGPLTAWAPVWSTLQADGSLKESQTGGWTGPRPERWLKVVKPGFVVGGFRFLVRIGAGVQTRQAQLFWKPWAEGAARGPLVTSRVYGAAAGPQDEVRIIELTLPEGAVPTGLYGETVAGVVSQVSLVVRLAPAPAAASPPTGKAPQATAGPTPPSVQGAGPREPTVPPVVLAKP